MTGEQWGPWIIDPYLHAANVGDYIFMYLMLDGLMRSWEGYTTRSMCKLKHGYMTDYNEIVRYRIRKPKGLTMLENIARDAKLGVDLVVDGV